MKLNTILDQVSSYAPDANLDVILRAYVYAAKAHAGQTRKSGEPYLVHPLAVAGILTDLKMDVDTIAVANLGDAYTAAGKTPFNLCLTDMRLPDGNGIDLIRHMHQHHPGVPVAMITAHGNMSSAIEALKAGAFDFVS